MKKPLAFVAFVALALFLVSVAESCPAQVQLQSVQQVAVAQPVVQTFAVQQVAVQPVVVQSFAVQRSFAFAPSVVAINRGFNSVAVVGRRGVVAVNAGNTVIVANRGLFGRTNVVAVGRRGGGRAVVVRGGLGGTRVRVR